MIYSPFHLYYIIQMNWTRANSWCFRRQFPYHDEPTKLHNIPVLDSGNFPPHTHVQSFSRRTLTPGASDCKRCGLYGSSVKVPLRDPLRSACVRPALSITSLQCQDRKVSAGSIYDVYIYMYNVYNREGNWRHVVISLGWCRCSAPFFIRSITAGRGEKIRDIYICIICKGTDRWPLASKSFFIVVLIARVDISIRYTDGLLFYKLTLWIIIFWEEYKWLFVSIWWIGRRFNCLIWWIVVLTNE